jgi:pyruvate/2-oxoglutarate dehydrogenase complex dihydrolipoamide dehydrogenase (E3) component
VEGRDRLLPLEEPEVGAAIAEAFVAEGIAVVTRARVARVDRRGESMFLTLDDERTLTASQVLVATGRRVDLEGLGLAAAGIDGASGFVPVDDRLRAADGVWAMGDVTGKAMFTHVALYQSQLVAADILGHDGPAAEYGAVPRVTFTDPEVGSVGLSEADARAAGVAVVTTVKPVPSTFRGWLHGPGNGGFVKLVADGRAGVLVGATSVGPHGGEVLGLLSVAVHAGIPLADLRRMIYAFPTFYGAVGEALGAYAQGLQDVLDPTGDRRLAD